MAFYMRRPQAFTLVAESEADAGQPTAAISGNRAPKQSGTPQEPSAAASPNGILGFIVAELRRPTGHIITIDVIAQARRLGVGSALLGAAEDHLRNSGALSVALETAVNNAAAIQFYKEKGYFVEKTVRGYYSNQLDALVMAKSLVGNR